MNQRLGKSWRQFRESEPGRRFQDRYERRQNAESGKLDPRKILNVALGIALILAGLFMVIFPGPGWLTVFLGLGFIAGEFRPVARFMDRLEVWARELLQKAARFWSNSPTATRVLVVVATLLVAAALAAATFLLFF